MKSITSIILTLLALCLIVSEAYQPREDHGHHLRGRGKNDDKEYIVLANLTLYENKECNEIKNAHIPRKSKDCFTPVYGKTEKIGTVKNKKLSIYKVKNCGKDPKDEPIKFENGICKLDSFINSYVKWDWVILEEKEDDD